MSVRSSTKGLVKAKDWLWPQKTTLPGTSGDVVFLICEQCDIVIGFGVVEVNRKLGIIL